MHFLRHRRTYVTVSGLRIRMHGSLCMYLTHPSACVHARAGGGSGPMDRVSDLRWRGASRHNIHLTHCGRHGHSAHRTERGRGDDWREAPQAVGHVGRAHVLR